MKRSGLMVGLSWLSFSRPNRQKYLEDPLVFALSQLAIRAKIRAKIQDLAVDREDLLCLPHLVATSFEASAAPRLVWFRARPIALRSPKRPGLAKKLPLARAPRPCGLTSLRSVASSEK